METALVVAVVVGIASVSGYAQRARQARKAFNPFAEQWVHVSPNSAVVFWQTGAEARDVETAGKGYVEYAGGKKTSVYSLPPVCENVGEGVRVFQKPSWSQFHRLTGLEPGKACSFRMVYVAPDGRTIKSKAMTLKTSRPEDAVALPGDLKGPPYVLDRAGATYVLTSDILADGTAFKVTADDVTLDLNGHRVVFGGKSGDKSNGVECSYKSGLRILNGIIEEGKGDGRRRYPVWLYACKKVTCAGLSLTYRSKDGQGIAFGYQGVGSEVHHNEIYDEGFDTTSRHQQLNAVSGMSAGSDSKFHHNIILRCRQSGIGIGASEAKARKGEVVVRNFEIYNNMIYQGSCMTNSMGVSVGGAVKDFKIHNNRIFGRGEMPECIFVGTGANTGEVSSNYTFSRSTGKVSKEYGATSSLAAGLRLCWGPFRLKIHENTFLTESGKTGGFTGNARCFWCAASDSRQPEWRTSGEIDVRDNEFTALVDRPGAGYARAVTICGDHNVSAHGIVLGSNRITSNDKCVVLSERYGCGSSDVKFVGNTFVRPSKAARFVLVLCGWWDKPTTGSSFIDSMFEGGASYKYVAFDGQAERDFSVGWILTLKTSPGAKVTIKDRDGEQVFAGTADAQGMVSAELLEYVQRPTGRTARTPHTVRVERDGRGASKRVTMDGTKEIRVAF